MKQQFHDLSFERLEDGTVRLEQHDYSGESVIIDLHPVQLLHIARQLHSGNGPAAERIDTLERRLRWILNRFEELKVALPVDFYERCSEAWEFSAWVDASLDVVGEFCADLKPEACESGPLPGRGQLALGV